MIFIMVVITLFCWRFFKLSFKLCLIYPGVDHSLRYDFPVPTSKWNLEVMGMPRFALLGQAE
jgi:hypothetical protein